MNSINREEFAKLINEAKIKPRIKRELRFVPEEITDWQDRDFLAVTNRNGSEGVLIAPLGQLYVASFQLQRRAANSVGRVEAVICDLCATWQRGSNSGIITFGNGKSSVSFLCCADLLCSLHIRDKTPEAKLSRTQLRETNEGLDRVLRLQRRLLAILEAI